ncbi:hypothetical protein L1987_82904 [Smallanthus sonchifolius]|uniref:Uncharacterized protein n=1 Tax=Smallanthus sonchifolius TaxID=185202 RepID=A0ACB8YFH2_9ASTR|nr:hypothetical protein L1987_82904 [Smallanthus sonchifolius]
MCKDQITLQGQIASCIYSIKNNYVVLLYAFQSINLYKLLWLYISSSGDAESTSQNRWKCICPGDRLPEVNQIVSLPAIAILVYLFVLV